MMQYKTYADSDSMYNTPPTFAWYLSGMVFKWLKKNGGLANQKNINESKANKLYSYIDQSDFYKNDVDKESRSIMNVPFLLREDSLNNKFLEESEGNGLLNLAGHRSVGGMRASIYNGVPEEGVDALIDFMKEFEKKMAEKNLPKNLTDNRKEIDHIDQKLLDLIHERSKLVINAGINKKEFRR